MDSLEKDILSKRLEPSSGVLYVVGTPIGNLGDLSPRAISILQKVSAIACEDTRRSGHLLKKIGAKAPLLSFYKHNTKSRVPKLLKLLKDGQSLAIISDAGLPGISDPGEALVSAARAEGHDVICIPGPCAATTALVSSGLPSKRFCFEGFLPTKSITRREVLGIISKETRTTVIYEAPHRLVRLLKELSDLCGKERPLRVARELTKLHEQQVGTTIGDALDYFSKFRPLGECTIVLGGAPSELDIELSRSELITKMEVLIKAGSTPSEAAREIAIQTGQTKRLLYALLHDIEPKDRN